MDAEKNAWLELLCQLKAKTDQQEAELAESRMIIQKIKKVVKQAMKEYGELKLIQDQARREGRVSLAKRINEILRG